MLEALSLESPIITPATAKPKRAERVPVISLRVVRETGVPYSDLCVRRPEDLMSLANNAFDLSNQAEELFVLICLDARSKPASLSVVSRGTVSATLVHPREIFKRALLSNAARVALVHNHPSGDPDPSKEDISLTRRLQDAGTIMGIEVIDHVVIGDGCFRSLRSDGLMKETE